MVDQAGRDVHHVTAVTPGQHRGHRGARDLEETAKVHSGDDVVVLIGVVGEILGHEDSRVVDHRVDPAEPLYGRVDDALAGTRLRDVTRHRQHHRVITVGDPAGVGDHRVAKLAVRRNQALADALRGAGDDCDAL
jgi:hypothetical protein